MVPTAYPRPLPTLHKTQPAGLQNHPLWVMGAQGPAPSPAQLSQTPAPKQPPVPCGLGSTEFKAVGFLPREGAL